MFGLSVIFKFHALKLNILMNRMFILKYNCNHVTFLQKTTMGFHYTQNKMKIFTKSEGRILKNFQSTSVLPPTVTHGVQYARQEDILIFNIKHTAKGQPAFSVCFLIVWPRLSHHFKLKGKLLSHVSEDKNQGNQVTLALYVQQTWPSITHVLRSTLRWPAGSEVSCGQCRPQLQGQESLYFYIWGKHIWQLHV